MSVFHSRECAAPDLAGRFPPEFYARPTLTVCRSVIGSYLVHASEKGTTAGRIVEAEAYLGPHDKGAHSFGGRPTERTRAMFGDKGHAYVFLIYGAYWCFNIVCGPAGKPQAVLIRALEPALGLDLMRARIGKPDAPAESLCRGPGKLCLTMGITKELYGEDLRGDRLFLVPGRPRRGETIARSVRLNIDYAEEYIHKPWRFFIQGNRSVSGPRRMG